MSTGTSAWAPQSAGGAPQSAGGAPQAAPSLQPGPSQPPPPYGWTPPPHGGAPVPAQHAAARPPRLWLWALVTAIAMVVAVAATAAITYAITRSAPSSNPAAAQSAPPSAPTFTAAEQSAAKNLVCQAFDVSSKGMQSQGGARVDGQPNLPMLLRTLSGTVSLQTALVPATPSDVADPARRVVSTSLDLMNAALGQANIADVNKANEASNDAVYALADACGLPR